MRKLHIINLGKMGGVEKLFLQYLQDNTVQQDKIFCVNDDIGAEIAPHLSGRAVTFVNRIVDAWKLNYPTWLRKYIFQLKLWLAKPDVIIVWDLVPRLLRKPARGTMIYYDHGCSWRYPLNNKTHTFLAMLGGCITASHAAKRVMELRFRLSCPIKVVPNRITPPAKIYVGDKKLSSPIRLGIAARLVALKGISVALLMMKTLKDRGFDATLEIAGKGPDEQEFKALTQRLGIEDRVFFLGFQDDLSDFFNHIHIYMSTPITEPFGLSCMESLFYGVPVIFPLIDGQSEVVLDQYCGIGLTPSVSTSEHFHLTGMNIQFPYHVYSPQQDRLVAPMLVSHQDCANAVVRLVGERYPIFRQNAFLQVKNRFDYSNFFHSFNQALNFFVSNYVNEN